tara:strand:- start:389 stop:652 length:264 start_codon:yes stop_codon:yes gene_type:complete
MSRKTIPVLQLLEYGNRMLKRTDEFATKEFKIGVICMIENVLHATGNYAGFMFLDNDDSDTGTLGYYSRHYFYSMEMNFEARRRRAS